MNFRRNFVTVALFASFSLFAACTTNPAPTATPVINQMPATAGKMPPAVANENNLAWRLVDGKRQKLADYKGKVVVLDFWATYCPPCEEEIPHLVELSKQNPDLNIIGLHVGGDKDRPFVADFVTKYKMSYKLGYPEQPLTDFYLQGDERIPQTLVFDREGRLIQKFVGFTAETKQNLDAAIQQALKQ